MKSHSIILCGMCAVLISGTNPVHADQQPDKAELMKEIRKLRFEFQEVSQSYKKRIEQLESRLEEIDPEQPEAAPPDSEQETPADDQAADDELKALRQAAEERASAKPEGSETPTQAASGTQQALNAFNPRITVFGDLLGRLDDRDVLNEDGEEINDRISLREVELDLRADVDPYAKGVMIAAFEEETPNDYHVTIEEGYATFETLPWNLRAKAGRFRTGFGQINKLHLHDLPQVNYPLPVRHFLGEEGDNQNGAAISYLAPPLGDNIVEAEFQLLNGENEAILGGNDSRSPAYLVHVKLFRDVGESQFVELGASHMFGYHDRGNSLQTHLSGLDFLYKWRPARRSEYRSFVFQSELFLLNRQQMDEDVNSFGTYAYVQYQPAKRWYVGMRGDYSQLPEDDNLSSWAVTPSVSYYLSEFLRLRLAYEHQEHDLDGPVDSAFFQLTFIFGSHPVEPYWFNK